MLKNATILIAEDDTGYTTLISKGLRRCGITNNILFFDNGQKIVDFLLHKEGNLDKQPRVVILDIHMPGVDGTEVLRAIKSDERINNTLVIMLTTASSQDEINRCYELGCNNFITKSSNGNYTEVINSLGNFLKIIEVPEASSVAAVPV